MHPRQASLLAQATEITGKVAAKDVEGATPVLWKYADEEGNVFYLETRKTTVKSPFSGKSFTAKPEKLNLGAVAKEMKEEAAKGESGAPGPKAAAPKTKKKADWKA